MILCQGDLRNPKSSPMFGAFQTKKFWEYVLHDQKKSVNTKKDTWTFCTPFAPMIVTTRNNKSKKCKNGRKVPT